ncbi:TRAPP II complex, partial [Catenaria anguillulae PL171]
MDDTDPYASIYAPHASCSVLVVPVGPIRTRAFKAALQLLRSCSPVALQDLTPTLGGPAGDVRSEFTAPTFPNGRLRFQFVSEYDDEYSTLEEFHASRRILAVIGILHCSPSPSAPQDLEHAVAAFTHHTLPKFTSALVTKCIAFAPQDYAPDRSVNLGANTTWIAAQPNQPETAYAPVQAVVADIATRLLEGFHDIATAIAVRSLIHSPPASALGSASPLGPDALVAGGTATGSSTATGGSPNSPLAMGTAALASAMQQTTASMMQSNEQKLRKRAPGRAAKLVADLLLLAGKLPAAIDKYLEAMDAAKANTDTLWLAASMDGLYTAMLTLRALMPRAHDELPSLPLIVREWLKAAGVPEVDIKFREVIGLYERADAPVLAAHVALRVAPILIGGLGSGPPRLVPGHSRMDALALVTQAMANAVADCISPRTQLDLSLRAAALCARLGFARKQAMCLTLAVRAMIAVLTQATTARIDPLTQYHVMDRLANLYGLLTVDVVGWPNVQTLVLDVCIQLADAVEDPGALTRLIVRCFQRLQSMLSMDGMLDIVARLQRASKGGMSMGEGAPTARQFGFLKEMTIVPPPPDLIVHKRPSTSASTEKDPFLYSAFSSKSTATPATTTLVATEPIAFTVHLINPFQFAVTLESLSLLAAPDDSSGLVPDPITITLPAMATHVAVTLRGTPTHPGTLKLAGIAFYIFGVREQCTFGVDAILAPTSSLSSSNSRPHSPTTTSATTSAMATLDFVVIPALPLVRVRPAGAAHRHLMLLAGQQSRDLALHLTNTSPSSLPVTCLAVQ